MNNIIFLIDTLEIGGAEKSLLSIHKNLSSYFDISIIVCKSVNEKYRVNSNITEIKSKRIFSLKSIFLIFKMFIAKKRSVILCFAPEIAALANIVNFFVFKKHKVVLSFRNSFYYYSNFNKFYVYLLFFAACFPSDAFHFLTEANKNSYFRIGFLKKFLQKKKYIVIPNYIRKLSFNFPIKYKSKNKPQIIFIGRLCEQKNPFEFIRFCDLLGKYLPNIFTYHIFGEGPLKESINKEIKSKKNVKDFKIYGKVNNIGLHLENPFALILTSSYEGHPGVVCEAISSGIPVFSFPYDSFIEDLLLKTSYSNVSLECNAKSLFDIFFKEYKNLLSKDFSSLDDSKLIENIFDRFEITKSWIYFFNLLNDV